MFKVIKDFQHRKSMDKRKCHYCIPNEWFVQVQLHYANMQY